MRAGKRAVFGLLAALAVASGARVSAHRLDEFLQTARIAVERDGVQLEMTLTPGTIVADGVIQDIDTDRNGTLSEEEEHAYAGRVIGSLTLSVDGASPLRLQAAGSHFADVAALRAGDGAIIVRAAAVSSRLPAGPHRLFFRNQNAPANSVYLANALVPESDNIAVTGQQRDGDQRELTIEFVVRDEAASSGRGWMWLGLFGALAMPLPLMRRARGPRLNRSQPGGDVPVGP